MDSGAPEGDLPPTFPAPARRALAGAGLTRLEQIACVSERELLALHGMGPKGVRLLREMLAERGLAFAGATPRPPSLSSENA
ncbi:MAG TPA: hypothetical protein VF665_05295 [Longimicrobium sp.]|jgi:hypothetical protein|uniref:hypothetical protein n=1 Tax=Longimicrobium sp. TaxID=2029185 RepID=UPI002ED8AC86